MKSAITFLVGSAFFMSCAVQPPSEARLESSSTDNAKGRDNSTSEFKENLGSNPVKENPKPNTQKLYGQISNESTDTAFKGKQVYGMYMDLAGSKMFSIYITDSSASIDSLLKKVKEAKCVKCPGDKCDDTPAGETPKLINLSFMGAMSGMPTAQVKADGFPKEAKSVYDQSRLSDGFSLSSTLVPFTEKSTGSITFSEGKLPAKVDDEFEAEIDSKLGASSYKAKVSGKVYQQHTFTYPTCDFSKERLDITYE